MSWSMNSVSYRMSGAGSWQNLLNSEALEQLYADIYPKGARVPKTNENLLQVFKTWDKAAIVRLEDDIVFPLGPLMMDEDLAILKPWFDDIAEVMCRSVRERLLDYNQLASALSPGADSRSIDNILTILIGAHTLDSWVFSALREELIGTYSPRNFAGDFFFWGYAFSQGPQRIFGFTSYGGLGWRRIHVIRSHGLDRESLKSVLRQRDSLAFLHSLYAKMEPGGDQSGERILSPPKSDNLAAALRRAHLIDSADPPGLAIPFFGDRDMRRAARLYQAVSNKIVDRFKEQMGELKALVGQCSFARCTWSDVLCMLFHLSYSFAADRLVEDGTLAEFPQSAQGEWGVWIH
ncbi:MAG: hypothetical protein JRD68_10805 [Deltaproteobacteria bacterium]|nr:hypothetical protein [Deltaproteobacteria bacterium]